MQRMLYITAFPPNNRSGGQVLSLNLINDLAEKYQIDLIYFVYPGHEMAENLPVHSVSSFKTNNYNCLLKCGIHPIFTRRFNKKILTYLRDIASGYDVLFFDYIQVGLYSVYIDHPCKALRNHDIIYQKYARKIGFLKYWIEPTERKILENVQKIFVLSKKDADLIRDIYHLQAIYTHDYKIDFCFPDKTIRTNAFVFFGLWSRRENLDGLVWFIKTVYPLVKNTVKFLIIGGGLPVNVQKMILSYKNIEYKGFVENPREILYASNALIAPLFQGAGVKIKAIDAFAAGTPVLGTEITFEGLPFMEGLQYKLSGPEKYADIINNFREISFEQKMKYSEQFKRLYKNHRISDYL